MYEVEYKVEITKAEKNKLNELFERIGFVGKDILNQNDFYISAEPSPLGGYNTKRYRDEGFRVLYTEKIWEDNDGNKIRREVEREVPRNIFLSDIKKYPNATKIKKDRKSFLGMYEGQEIHIDMDDVKFDHSPSVRHFIEAEVLSENRDAVVSLREGMKDFLTESLGRSEIKEASGMFTMAFEKK